MKLRLLLICQLLLYLFNIEVQGKEIQLFDFYSTKAEYLMQGETDPQFATLQTSNQDKEPFQYFSSLRIRSHGILLEIYERKVNLEELIQFTVCSSHFTSLMTSKKEYIFLHMMDEFRKPWFSLALIDDIFYLITEPGAEYQRLGMYVGLFRPLWLFTCVQIDTMTGQVKVRVNNKPLAGDGDNLYIGVLNNNSRKPKRIDERVLVGKANTAFHSHFLSVVGNIHIYDSDINIADHTALFGLEGLMNGCTELVGFSTSNKVKNHWFRRYPKDGISCEGQGNYLAWNISLWAYATDIVASFTYEEICTFRDDYLLEINIKMEQFRARKTCQDMGGGEIADYPTMDNYRRLITRFKDKMQQEYMNVWLPYSDGEEEWNFINIYNSSIVFNETGLVWGEAREDYPRKSAEPNGWIRENCMSINEKGRIEDMECKDTYPRTICSFGHTPKLELRK